ncbi:MAG TPA: RidA family protein [Thermoanaerobaculia bacterium]|jgi:reactive intermediate/imine deaminase
MARVTGVNRVALRKPSPGDPQFLPSPDPALAALPFSEAVRHGDLLFVSGQIGTAPGTLNVVPGGIEAEARQALLNMKAILERHGSSMERVVKCTVFLADMKEWPAFNEVYRSVFRRNLPARSALGANGLALGARVEVECLAALSPPASRGRPGPPPSPSP